MKTMSIEGEVGRNKSTKCRVLFNFNCINKNNLISGKSGQIEITTDQTTESIKKNKEIISLIANEMEKKTRQTVISLEIKEVQGIETNFESKKK